MKEQWKVIDEDGVAKDTYLISNFGRIKSRTRVYYTSMYHSKRVAKGQFMKPSITAKKYSSGYYAQPLRKADGSGAKTFLIHRLVAKYFLSDFSEDLVVNHKDENTFNNKVDNLEMITQKENANYGTSQSRKSTTYKKNNSSSAAIKVVISKGDEVKYFPSLTETAKYLGVGTRMVRSATKNQRHDINGWVVRQDI